MTSEPLGEKLQAIRRDVEPPYAARMIGDGTIIVFDHDHGSSLYARGFYGKPIGIKKPDPTLAFDRELQLDPLEALHLIKKGWLRIESAATGAPVSREDLRRIAAAAYDKFEDKYLVYEDLRAKGYVARPGLKFGADFVVYKQGPGLDHSAFVVLVLEHENTMSAMDMVRAGRLATSVKKRFVIASISSVGGAKHVTYYVFRWYKP